MKYQLKREPNSNLFLVNIEIDRIYELKMILDTGASHTTIDSNALYLLGYDFSKSTGRVEIETANGVIETDVYEVKSFSCVGIKRDNFQIQVYDFIAHGIFSDYNGLLGLDFLDGLNFCINTVKSEITITKL